MEFDRLAAWLQEAEHLFGRVDLVVSPRPLEPGSPRKAIEFHVPPTELAEQVVSTGPASQIYPMQPQPAELPLYHAGQLKGELPPAQPVHLQPEDVRILEAIGSNHKQTGELSQALGLGKPSPSFRRRLTRLCRDKKLLGNDNRGYFLTELGLQSLRAARAS